MPEQPDRIGRYEIEVRIAQGGQGRLYKAYDPFLHRPVAIKLLREPDDQDLRARFAREARAVANLTHPNIVTIFEVGEHNGQPFMAMEFIHGLTLRTIIESDPMPSIVRRLELMENLCDGLAFAHRRDVIHRDIKPENLMLDGDGRLKVVDFGIARAAADANLTQSGLLVGTFNYMSPEQVDGLELDGRSDMFAVGAVFYELLCRRKAFPGKTPAPVLHKIAHEHPEPIERILPDLDPSIVAIVNKALEKDRTKRFADLREMRMEIARAREVLEELGPNDAGASMVVAHLDTETLPPPSWRRGTDLEELVRRRTQQIEERLTAAQDALNVGHHEEAITKCEEALVIDPSNSRARTLADRARLERDETAARRLLTRAQDELKRGELTAAAHSVREALTVMPDSPEAVELGRVIRETRAAREREAQRVAALETIVARARTALDAGDTDGALSAANEALVSAPAHTGAIRIKEEAERLIAQRQREARDDQARQTAAEARRLFDDGEHAEALALLEEFWPAHTIVSQLWGELSAEAAQRARVTEATLAGDIESETVFGPSATAAEIADPGVHDQTLVTPTPFPAPPPRTQPTTAIPITGSTPTTGLTPTTGSVPTPAPQRATTAEPAEPEYVAAIPQSAPARETPPGTNRRVVVYAAAAVLVIASAVAIWMWRGHGTEGGSTTGVDGGSGGQIARGNDPGLTQPDPAPLPPDGPAVSRPDRGGDIPPALPNAAGTPSSPAPPPGRGTPVGTTPGVTPVPSAGGSKPDRGTGPGGGERAAPVTIPPVVDVPPPVVPKNPPDEGRPPEITKPEAEKPEAPKPSPPAVVVAETPRPDKPAAPPAAPPPAAPVLSDEQRIQRTLAAYTQALSNRDVDAVIQVYPNGSRKELTQTFATTLEFRMEILSQSTRVDANAATVAASVKQWMRKPGDRLRETEQRLEFQMERKGDGWIIRNIRLR